MLGQTAEKTPKRLGHHVQLGLVALTDQSSQGALDLVVETGHSQQRADIAHVMKVRQHRRYG